MNKIKKLKNGEPQVITFNTNIGKCSISVQPTINPEIYIVIIKGFNLDYEQKLPDGLIKQLEQSKALLTLNQIKELIKYVKRWLIDVSEKRKITQCD